jgi:chaperonin GroEL (HSP60 family)
VLLLAEEVNREAKPLVIVAEDIESEALATLIVNRTHQPPSCALTTSRVLV